MFHNQIQQVQQKISAVQQMVSNIRQSEQTNQQRLQQLAQDEAYASQQLQRVQQLCQELSSNLQNITFNQSFTGLSTNQGYTSPTEMAHFGTAPTGGFSSTSGFSTTGMPMTQTYQGSSFFDPSMNMGGMQGILPTSTNLSGIATMKPDTYLASRDQFLSGAGGTTSLGQIGQQAGISTSGISSGMSSTGMPSSGMSSSGLTKGFNQ